MLKNPFTPVFGGKPQFFFGRRDILARFDRAMIDPGSEDRALFITGTRGSGKTALLEQLSRAAQKKGRKVIDLSSENTVEILVRNLIRHSEETKTLNPQASVSIFGTGASLGAGSVAKTTTYTTADLQMIFLDACAHIQGGLLITIDEVQKVSEADLTAICDAFQMASRKGYDVMIAVAGLPFSHAQTIQYKGCTYLRRAAHDEIGLFSREETEESLREAFARVSGMEVVDGALHDLVAASYGHPYLMQLLGYHLVLICDSRSTSNIYVVKSEDVQDSIAGAVESYERRALDPMLDELTVAEHDYLKAMSSAMGDRSMVKSAEIAEKMGKTSAGLSRQRDSLLRLGIIAAPAHGFVMFAIPLLRQYVLKDPPARRNIIRALDWGV